MELLLNLTWLLLALPAYWLWRECGSARRRFSSWQCLLALACAIVVLFPVISATDDLRVMRAEVEELPSTKRSVGHRSSDRPSVSRSHSQPAIPVVPSALFTPTEAALSPEVFCSQIAPGAAAFACGRAPPATSIA